MGAERLGFRLLSLPPVLVLKGRVAEWLKALPC